MEFEQAHSNFMQQHLAGRAGERLGRLERGHHHAETLFLRNVWWPLMGHLEHLHPEYEVSDWRGRSYFADFAWLPGNVRLLFEIKGFATHVRDMDRQKYCSELNRETFLYAMGYQVLSFAYDDVEQRPDLCITLLRLALGRHQTGKAPTSRVLLMEKELIKLALSLARPLRPIDVKLHLGLNYRTSASLLHSLCEKGWMRPAQQGNRQRIVKYELMHGMVDFLN
ncbi:hypothetical protein [Paenibacillus donghaensis]|uniref:DUF559 domain-containing protein n=1 Tax=Paenibacillus donghaensis TaxID=414771 RepID=A0A2Z2KMC3_9BACL|nr:hypothetical protein [Paenibacillus donghaensis]ASA24650.1 hypothetical protein B9T62_30195 [Paenibacillus donghaensis]